MFSKPIVKMSPGQRFRHAVVSTESYFFDVIHNVQTSGYECLTQRTSGGEVRDNFWHLPIRPATARQVLRDLPVANHSDYTFVDIGSGKGRMLLLAAQYPFRAVQGIEFVTQLHNTAERNVTHCRNLHLKCTRIECLNVDAADYRFPNENLVVYFFHPFGPATMEKVLEHLDTSLERHPRDVILANVFPETAFLVERLSRLKLYKRTRKYDIHRSTCSAEGEPPSTVRTPAPGTAGSMSGS